MIAPKWSALITREPKHTLKLIKSGSGWQMGRFGHVSVTLSNACETEKVCRQNCAVLVNLN